MITKHGDRDCCCNASVYIRIIDLNDRVPRPNNSTPKINRVKTLHVDYDGHQQPTIGVHVRGTYNYTSKDLLTRSRTRSLLVIIGSFTSLFCTVGFLNSAGVFLEYYARDQLSSQSPSTIAWIGATAIFFLFAISPVAGAMLDAIGPKVRDVPPNVSNDEKTDDRSNRPWSTPAPSAPSSA